jgi:hypothetical protein
LSHPEIVSCASLAAVIDPVAHGKGKDKLWKENGVKYVPQRKNKSKKMPLYYQLAENTKIR